MNKFLFCILVIGGITLYPSESGATAVVSQSEGQASIRFIEGEIIKETTDEFENGQSDKTNIVNNGIIFPKTGERKINYFEGIGILLVGLVLLISKIKKIEKRKYHEINKISTSNVSYNRSNDFSESNEFSRGN